MSNRSYSEINFHMTWHTKDNHPFINASLEPDLYAFIKDRILKMPNVYFHAIGGIFDHIHLGASFYPPFEIDRWIGDIKGASSHEFGRSLQWQLGYGGCLIWNQGPSVGCFLYSRSERAASGRTVVREVGANSPRGLS